MATFADQSAKNEAVNIFLWVEAEKSDKYHRFWLIE